MGSRSLQTAGSAVHVASETVLEKAKELASHLLEASPDDIVTGEEGLHVVGVPSTHGVIFDFIRRLKKNPSVLEVLGNGTQQKTYLHVSELVEAMIFINQNTEYGLHYYNIGANDDGLLVKQIAEETVKVVSPDAKINYQKKDRGWVGDVPSFFYSVQKLSNLGWSPTMSSLEAVQKAIREIATQEKL